MSLFLLLLQGVNQVCKMQYSELCRSVVLRVLQSQGKSHFIPTCINYHVSTDSSHLCSSGIIRLHFWHVLVICIFWHILVYLYCILEYLQYVIPKGCFYLISIKKDTFVDVLHNCFMFWSLTGPNLRMKYRYTCNTWIPVHVHTCIWLKLHYSTEEILMQEEPCFVNVSIQSLIFTARSGIMVHLMIDRVPW